MTPPEVSSPVSAPNVAPRASRPISPGFSPLVVELPLPPKALSANSRVHWTKRHSSTKQYRHSCGWAFRAAAVNAAWACQQNAVPVEISMVYQATKGAKGYIPRDLQNAITAVKALVDSLQDAAIIPNDSKAWLSWGEVTLITNKRDPAYTRDGVTVTLRPIE